MSVDVKKEEMFVILNEEGQFLRGVPQGHHSVWTDDVLSAAMVVKENQADKIIEKIAEQEPSLAKESQKKKVFFIEATKIDEKELEEYNVLKRFHVVRSTTSPMYYYAGNPNPHLMAADRFESKEEAEKYVAHHREEKQKRAKGFHAEVVEVIWCMRKEEKKTVSHNWYIRHEYEVKEPTKLPDSYFDELMKKCENTLKFHQFLEKNQMSQA